MTTARVDERRTLRRLFSSPMASLIDDLVRRERDKYDLLANLTQNSAMLDPLREKERFLGAISSAGITSALKMREQMLGEYESSLVPAFTAQLVEETTKLNRLLGAERQAFTDSVILSSARITDQIERIIEPRLADQLKAFAVPSSPSTFRDAIVDSSVAMSRMALVDFSRSTLTSTASIAGFMRDTPAPFGVADLLAEFVSEAERLAVAGAFVTPEGLRIGGDLVAAADLTAHLRQAVTSAAAVPREERLREFLTQCLVIIRRAPKPIAKALLVVVSTIFLWVVAGEVQAVSGELLRPYRQALIAKIRKVTRLKAPHALRDSRAIDLRVVVAEGTLHVRIYPRTNDSRILGKLQLGDAVVALRCMKDWTLVRYMEGDAVITGWVYTRYLQKVATLPPAE